MFRRYGALGSENAQSVHHHSVKDALIFTTIPRLERLLILHINLAEICTGNTLDESSSDEERLENILYYYSSTNDNISNNTDASFRASENNTDNIGNRLNSNRAEILQFAGLCQALYQLPGSLQSNQADQYRSETDIDNVKINTKGGRDCTHYVTLENHYLIFTCVERIVVKHTNTDDNGYQCCDVVVVAQVTRHSDIIPAAVDAAIQRTHALFRLLRQGGIHAQLLGRQSVTLHTDASENESKAGTLTNSIVFNLNETPTYPGMLDLYKTLKQIRKLKEKMKLRTTFSEVIDKEVDDIQQLEIQISNLESTLPIFSLRRDLEVHYNAFTLDRSSSLSQFTTIGRPLFELTPTPVAELDGSHRFASFPVLTHSVSFTLPQLNSIIGNLLSEGGAFSQYTPIRGISVFYKNKLLQTHSRQVNSLQVANDTVVLLYHYFSSYRYQMVQLQNNTHNTGLDVPPPELLSPTRPSRKSLINYEDQVTNGTSATATTDGFLPPPPLSLLSVSDGDDDEQVVTSLESGFDNGVSIWAPKIYLQCRVGGDDAIQPFRVCLLDKAHFSFLLFLACDLSDTHVFTKLEEELSQALMFSKVSNDECRKEVSTTETPMSLWDTADCDVIFIDRTNEQITILPKSRKDSTKKKKKLSRFFGLKSSYESPNNTPVTVEADCRHYLASRLRHDALAALDDSILRVQESRIRQSKKDFVYEACHLLSKEWLYVKATGDSELYLLLDSSKHVTVADVKKVADRVYANMIESV